MIGRLNHVAIAVPDLSAAMRRYRDLLGADVGEATTLLEHGVRIAFVTLENSVVELMEPLDGASPIARFLERRPQGGLHHICYEVPDIASSLEAMKDAGVRVLGPVRVGAHGRPVVFLDPADFDGALIELEEVRPELQPA
ncbi:methylmalonyl-CoA epimerase [Arsenicitalea aurantiaca]|uniref:Methylmalonyl-CoA epimerase n=1 Tax=Arsenicitalea aurantiaca TaxID=1783274 RepID=A0A433XLH8_9HYPH|nr:methylmalonyl-CoA epimerase [Arsenicitalea aurantiaca]RUT34942.1 methylmalonyl-CoA epimerase [Arsenicitalea aurantiaca]